MGAALALSALWLPVDEAAAQTSPATAQPTTHAAEPVDPGAGGETEVQHDAVFQQLLKDPTNVELNIRYAELAAKLRRYEQAISALERLLLFNPNLPQVKVELGALYFKLGSYDVAIVYLSQAKQANNLPAESRSRADSILAEIESLRSPSKLDASVLAGFRYQTNANAGPAGAGIIAGGVPATLNREFVRKADWNAFFAGTAEHRYDLGTDVPTSLVTDAEIYYARQFDVTRVDLGVFELDTGPRFELSAGDTQLFSAHPYLIVNDVLLGDRQYFWTVGGGLEVHRAITNQLGISIDYENRLKRFSNSTLFPTATGFDSDTNAVDVELGYKVLENGKIVLGSSYADEDARAQFNSNWLWELHAAYSHKFQLPWEFPAGPLVLTPAIARIYTTYGAPNHAVSLTEAEVTQEWRYLFTAQLGLTKHFAGTVQFVRQQVWSQLPNFKYNDTQVIMGLLWNY